MNRDRLRYVAERYPQLQGLRLLPLALVFFVAAAWRAGVVRFVRDSEPGIASIWVGSGLAVAVILSFPIRQWYGRRFGVVLQRPAANAAWPMLAVAMGVAVAAEVQQSLGLPFSLPAALMGVVVSGIGVAHYPLRRHYLAIGALCFAFASLGLLGVPSSVHGVALDLTIGLALLVAGIGDHVLVAGTFRPVQHSHV
jgi:hypothetical protein